MRRQSFRGPTRLYRCQVCRLEMTFDPWSKKIKPLEPNGRNGTKSRKTA